MVLWRLGVAPHRARDSELCKTCFGVFACVLCVVLLTPDGCAVCAGAVLQALARPSASNRR